jgi:hypothetical protein
MEMCLFTENYKSKRECLEVREKCRKLHNEEPHNNLFSSASILG